MLRVLVGVWAAVGVVVGTLGNEICLGSTPREDEQCGEITIRRKGAEDANMDRSVLTTMCSVGRRHVKRSDQFAIVNLHPNTFSDIVTWVSGSADPVICDEDWKVDDVMQLGSSNRWYRYGLPMWPLKGQAVPKKLLRRSDWPNYAMATPLYLVPDETAAGRDPWLAAVKLLKKGKYSKAKKFMEFVKETYTAVHSSPGADECQDWFTPFMYKSLPSMLRSFKREMKRCPKILYVYFARNPEEVLSLKVELGMLLRVARCSETKLVVGFSAAS